MSVTLPRQTADVINEQAAEWVARLDSRVPTAEDEAEMENWLHSDPRCFGAYARARAIYLSPKLDAAMGVRRLMPVTIAWSRRGFMAAAAASIAAAAVFLVGRQNTTARYYESLMGEIRQIPLEDGSHITLNSNSVVTVEYRKNMRLIRLVRGEAFFDVAKSAERPFIVMGPMAQVRTIGTSYSVRLVRPSMMRVQVATGRVALESPPSTLAQSLMSWSQIWPDFNLDEKSGVFVNANQMASIRLTDEASDTRGVLINIDAVPTDFLSQALMWRQGQLSFEGETLAEAAAEFARYSERKIIISDKILANKHISGLFAANDPAGFARAAAVSLNANISEKNGSIILYK